MSRNSNPPEVVQRAIDTAEEIDGAYITNIDVNEVGEVGVSTPPPTIKGLTYIFTEEETFHINQGMCSCSEGKVTTGDLDTFQSFDEAACEHILSALDARPFDGLCECGHAEYHTVDIYAGGEPVTGRPRCTYCNRDRLPVLSDNKSDTEEYYVEHSGRILAGPMNQTEAREYVVEAASLNVSAEDDLDPICPDCETAQEVAVRSSNITGYLCPVCDDPTTEIQ